ncbi:MAG: ABC transporter ATP-binding protein [Planctomycetes bacterium]|nr:ABC transporter ATP-binding protein [Planctomycetota bacterium]
MSDPQPVPEGSIDATATREPVYRVRGLKKSFAQPNGNRLVVLEDADLDVHHGEFLLVRGKSGIGKSTFLHILGLLDRADSGSLIFAGEDVLKASRRRRAELRASSIGFVFQFFHLLPEFSALENLLLSGKVRHGPLAWSRRRGEAQERARELLDLVGLADRADHRPNQLSGGERQRVALARAMFNEPRILLCDEPTGNLDVKTSEAMHELLAELHARTGQTLIVVTHDPSLMRYAGRCVDLVSGRFVASEDEAQTGSNQTSSP